MTAHYRQLIKGGDGPAFLSLDVEPPALALERVKQAGLPASTNGGQVDFAFESPLGYVFFAGLNQSPTDRPEHFAHANAATSLVGVTLAGETLDPERALFRLRIARVGLWRRRSGSRKPAGEITHGVELTFATGAAHDAR